MLHNNKSTFLLCGEKTDSTDSPGPPSKAAALRLLVSQRLAAASREILAAVDSTVAGYEEEASGFRRELERQRRQLEALLQPRAAGVNRSRSLRPAEEEEGENKDGDRSSSRRQFEENQISETRNHVNLRIRILEDPHTKVLSKHVLRKCPMLKLRCPRALQEADFLEWLRSISPRLAGDKPFDILTSNKRRRLKRLRLKTLTLEEICRHVGCAGWETSTLFIRPKEQKQPEAGEEEIHCLQTRGSSSEDSSSAAGATLTFETSIPGQEVEGGRMDDLSLCSTSQQDAVTEEAEDNCWIMKPDEKCAATSKSDDDNKEEERQRANESDGYWKPDKCDEELKGSDSELTKNQNARCSEAEAKTENNDAAFSCKVCGALYQSEVTLVKHVWTHMDSSESLCGVCGERPESLEALKDHLQSRHRTEDCHVCGESFLGALSLSEHVAAHSGERPHRCHVCCASFALMSSLENHQKLHKEDELYKCYTCHKVFELKEQLKAHRRTHNKKGAHLCGVCGKSLSDYRSLSRHKMIHSGERPHSCQVCGRSFKLPGTLRQHEKIHTDRERSYLCDVCCKMFLTSKQLQIHMRTHTNEKPYHCGECGKGFTTKGPLTIHMRVHTGETPYRCPDCGWSFKRKINLDNHVTVHSGAKPFVCGICGKACARKTYLTVHMRTHNGERPYKCTLCDKAFTQSHCLKTHMKSHMAAENNT